MTPGKKVWIVGLCIIVVLIGIAIMEAKKDSAAAYARSLNETPYLIKEYGNEVYLVEMNPKQHYYYEEEDALALGLSKMKSKCNIISRDTWMGQNGVYAILVTTSGACEVAAIPYQRLH